MYVLSGPCVNLCSHTVNRSRRTALQSDLSWVQVVTLDPNERFAGIEQIMEAKRELGRQLEASDIVNNYVFEEMCLEWSIFDPAVDS